MKIYRWIISAVKICAFLNAFLVSFTCSCEFYFGAKVIVCRESTQTLKNEFFDWFCEALKRYNNGPVRYNFTHSVILSRINLEILQPSVFNCMASNMMHIDISRNRIRDLPSNIFVGMRQLKHLDISSNRIQGLPKGIFDDLVGLETIYGHSNSIKNISFGLFNNLTNLQEIRLDNNDLESLDMRLFANLTRLLHLNLNRNKLKNFDGILPQHRRIKTAEVEYKHIEKLKTTWQNRIEILVENNTIESADFHIPEYVAFLSLKGNKLEKFPAAVQKHSDNTADFKVTLSGNLWTCDCSALPLKKFLSEHGDKVIDIDEVTCRLPHPHNDQHKVSDTGMQSTTTVVNNYSIAAIAIGVTIMLIVMVALVVYYIKNGIPFSCNCSDKSTDADSATLVEERKLKLANQKQFERF